MQTILTNDYAPLEKGKLEKLALMKSFNGINDTDQFWGSDYCHDKVTSIDIYYTNGLF